MAKSHYKYPSVDWLLVQPYRYTSSPFALKTIQTGKWSGTESSAAGVPYSTTVARSSTCTSTMTTCSSTAVLVGLPVTEVAFVQKEPWQLARTPCHPLNCTLHRGPLPPLSFKLLQLEDADLSLSLYIYFARSLGPCRVTGRRPSEGGGPAGRACVRARAVSERGDGGRCCLD